MGRPTKQGIDYFPLDVGFFTDLKVRKVSRSCGSKSTSILICLLCNIYRNNGYYLVWDQDMPFVIADEIGVSEEDVNEVVVKALQVGFFNNEIYEKCNILTSAGIQKRYILATYQRKERQLNEEYLVFHTNNQINCANNKVNCTESTQIKENKNKKENNTKVLQKKSETRFSPPTIDQIKEYICSNKYNVDAERFFNFYQSKGWYVGKNKMKDWKAAVRTWVRGGNDKPRGYDIGVILTNNSTDKYNDEDKWNR